MPEKPSKFLPALYGGLIIGAISGIPFLNIVNCFCCAGVLLGGFLSVLFYKNELTGMMPPLTSSDSMQVGALAGVFGAVFGSLVSAMILAALGSNPTGEIVLEFLRNLDLPPEALEQAERSIEESSSMTMVSMLISFVTSLVIDPLFGLLGGLIGYSVFKPKGGAAAAPPPAQQQVPPPPPRS
jgi:hypothetical protein